MEKAEIMEFTRLALARAVSGAAPGGGGEGAARTQWLRAPSPVFLTLVLDGATRACQGSMEASAAGLAQEIEAAARRLVAGDRRHPPLRPQDVARGQLAISIPGQRVPLPSAGVDPRRFGLLVETDAGGSGVLLPGEARTFTWMLREARRRAGAVDETGWRAWVFPTEVFGEGRLPGLEPEAPGAKERRRQ
jgi:AMMECR1 domain-containing protein